jgi:hypothetical protein
VDLPAVMSGRWNTYRHITAKLETIYLSDYYLQLGITKAEPRPRGSVSLFAGQLWVLEKRFLAVAVLPLTNMKNRITIYEKPT